MVKFQVGSKQMGLLRIIWVFLIRPAIIYPLNLTFRLCEKYQVKNPPHIDEK